MGPTWVLPAPDGPHVGPMSLAIMIVYSLRCDLTNNILLPFVNRQLIICGKHWQNDWYQFCDLEIPWLDLWEIQKASFLKLWNLLNNAFTWPWFHTILRHMTFTPFIMYESFTLQFANVRHKACIWNSAGLSLCQPLGTITLSLKMDL